MISKPIYSFLYFLFDLILHKCLHNDRFYNISHVCVCMSKPIGAWLSRFKPIICRFEINLCKCLMQINHIFSLTIHLGRSDSCRRLKLGGSQNRHIKIGKWLQIYKLPITTITLFSLCQRVSEEEILDFFSIEFHSFKQLAYLSKCHFAHESLILWTLNCFAQFVFIWHEFTCFHSTASFCFTITSNSAKFLLTFFNSVWSDSLSTSE